MCFDTLENLLIPALLIILCCPIARKACVRFNIELNLLEHGDLVWTLLEWQTKRRRSDNEMKSIFVVKGQHESDFIDASTVRSRLRHKFRERYQDDIKQMDQACWIEGLVMTLTYSSVILSIVRHSCLYHQGLSWVKEAIKTCCLNKQFEMQFDNKQKRD